jgi:hypothetical protein
LFEIHSESRESCSSFCDLQNHILFQFFQAQKDPFLIVQSLKQFELGLNPFEIEFESDLKKCRRPLLWSRPTGQRPTSPTAPPRTVPGPTWQRPRPPLFQHWPHAHMLPTHCRLPVPPTLVAMWRLRRPIPHLRHAAIKGELPVTTRSFLPLIFSFSCKPRNASSPPSPPRPSVGCQRSHRHR